LNKKITLIIGRIKIKWSKRSIEQTADWNRARAGIGQAKYSKAASDPRVKNSEV